MKKSINIIALGAILLIAQACGPKSESKEAAEAAEAAKATVVKTATPLTVAERREKMKKEKEALAEKRRIALDEAAKKEPTFNDAKGEVVYNRAEKNPEFVGGQDAMDKYFSENLKYPKDAMDRGVEGTFFVDFVVGSNGVVRNAEITDEIGDGLDQSLRDEALRLVNSMPNWVAGRQRGKAVPVKFSLPVTFQMN